MDTLFETTILQTITHNTDKNIFKYFQNLYFTNLYNWKKLTTIYDYFTLYCMNEFNDNDMLNILMDLLKIRTNNRNMNKFIEEWLRYIKNEEKVFKILKLFISTIYMNNFKPEDKFHLMKIVWSFSKFRKSIKYETNVVIYNSIFSPFFDGETYKDHTNMLLCLGELINDKTIHINLVQIIWNIFNTMNHHNTYITNYVLILLNIVKQYDIKYIVSKIKQNNNNYIIQRYEIKNLKCFYEKLYITTLFGIAKNNIDINNIYNINNIEIAEIITSYQDVYKHIMMDDIFYNHMKYIKHTIRQYDIHSVNLYIKYMSALSNKLIKNPHTRYDSIETMAYIFKFNHLNKKIYSDIFIENFLNYIIEVNYSKLAFKETTVLHHLKITELLSYFTDYIISKKINLNLDNIISNVIFKLCKFGIENIDEVIIRLNVINLVYSIPYDIIDFLNMVVESTINTLSILKKVYKYKILKETFEEVNNILIIFIEKLFESLTIKNHKIYQITKLVNSYLRIIDFVYEIYYYNLTDNMIQNITHMKNKLLDTLDLATVSNIIKKNIKEKLSNVNININEDDYPSDFIDPISCCLIKNPCLIPNTYVFHDKLTIITQIKYEPINPYTKEPLTEQIFEEYNKRPDVIQKINEFKVSLSKIKKN
jgi:hypothetical protein